MAGRATMKMPLQKEPKKRKPQSWMVTRMARPLGRIVVCSWEDGIGERVFGVWRVGAGVSHFRVLNGIEAGSKVSSSVVCVAMMSH